MKNKSEKKKLSANRIDNHPLQTQEWAQFRKAWGNEVLFTKYGLITIHRIALTKHSIGIFEKGPAPTKLMLQDLKKIGRENNLIFIKLEPNVPIKVNGVQWAVDGEKSKTTTHNIPITDHAQNFQKLLHSHGAVAGKTLFTPTTFWIDLTKSEADLMKSFSSKTRYNIRLAEKKGVKIAEDNSDKAFQKYLDLTFETTQRQGFYAHTPNYHKLMWKYLHPASPKLRGVSQPPIAHLLTAKYKGEIITTWILFTWKDFLYYPYGASTDKYKEVMANNLMMWEVIKFGKKMGLKTFDLWGREEGKGFTKFKEGYNPQVVEFLGSWDLVINKPLYFIYRIAEKVRWYFLKLKSKFSKTS
jgi:lipid II:glycine glycyltransferase (peptidoglycan interpeptide bridge formation enzyme)